MAPEVTATLLGVSLTAFLAVCAAAFHFLRTDIRDLRTEFHGLRTEFQGLRTDVSNQFAEWAATTNAQFAEVNSRLDRLEGKVDQLIMALASSGFLTNPQAAAPALGPSAPASALAPQPGDVPSAEQTAAAPEGTPESPMSSIEAPPTMGIPSPPQQETQPSLTTPPGPTVQPA